MRNARLKGQTPSLVDFHSSRQGEIGIVYPGLASPDPIFRY